MKQIFVNDEPTTSTAETLSDLLAELQLEGRPCATLLNGNLIRRTDRERQALRENDKVEIISMVGGG